MKIKGKKETLLEYLQSVQINSSKTTLPILSYIFISASENKTTLITTDLELSIKNQVELEILEEGSICLPLKKLLEIIRELQEKEDVLIEVDESNRAVISTKNSVFHLFGLPKEDFPAFPEYVQEKSLILSSFLIKEMIRKTIFACNTNEPDFNLSGIFFVVEGKECKMVATDRHRLAFITKVLPYRPAEISMRTGVIIPIKVLMEIQRIISEDKDINIFLDKNKIVFQVDNLVIVSRLIEGKFPDYERIFPAEMDNFLTINNQKLYASCRRVALMTSEKTNTIKFDLSKDRLNLSCNTPNLGDAKEDLEVNFQGDDIEISFNPKYIMDVLKNIEQEEINISFTSPLNPVVIGPSKEKEGEEYLYIIMPIRA